jgi:hypothetical protein
MLSKSIKTISFAFLSLILLFATLNLHSRSGEFNYHSEIFSDKAGYQVYLPALFIYNFNATEFPDSIEFRTGEGFILNRESNKIFTKYPSGVAFMQAPFFLAAHAYCKIFEPEKANGYSRPYHYATDIAAVVYVLIGLIFLFQFLSFYYPEKTVLYSLIFFLLGTNLFYYATKETGLSHAYSFFLCSAWLLTYKKLIANSEYQNKSLFTLAFITGLIILVRQINLLFLPFFVLLDIELVSEIVTRFKKIGLKRFLVMVLIIGFVMSPQIAYNYYLFDSPFAYSYGNESFIYKFNPQFNHVLFSFENGLFAMNPIHIFTVLGILILIKNSKNGWIQLLLFSAVSYVYAAWWSPQLGCGLGHRGFVEFYAFFALAFTAIIQKILSLKNSSIKIPFLLIIIALIALNLKISYTYDGCWYGKTIWDTNEFIRLVIS